MENKIIELENDFSDFVRCGKRILNYTKSEIKSHFSLSQNSIIELPGLDGDAMLEVSFNYGTLTCLVDETDICRAGYFFFDEDDLYAVYREICNDKCEIVVPDVWKHDDCYIELKESKDVGFYFVFSLQYNLFSDLFG